jgi:hypothetical protein
MSANITSCVLPRLSRYEKVFAYRACHNGATSSLDTTATGDTQNDTDAEHTRLDISDRAFM